MASVDDQLARLVRNYRTPIDEATAEEFRHALADVALPILEAAISRTIRSRRFFPNIAEVLEDVGAVSPARASEPQPFTPCDDCNNGWITVPAREIQRLVGYDGGGRAMIEPTKGGLTTRHCECYLQWRRSQGFTDPPSRPSVHVDRDRAIGDHAWKSSRELADGASARVQQRRLRRAK